MLYCCKHSSDTTDTSNTETDSASTLHSYDMERIRQLAAVIRRKGADKPPVTPSKKTVTKRIAKSKRSASEKKDGQKGVNITMLSDNVLILNLHLRGGQPNFYLLRF